MAQQSMVSIPMQQPKFSTWFACCLGSDTTWNSPRAAMEDVHSLLWGGSIIKDIDIIKNSDITNSLGKSKATARCMLVHWGIAELSSKSQTRPTQPVMEIFGVGSTLKERKSLMNEYCYPSSHPSVQAWWRMKKPGVVRSYKATDCLPSSMSQLHMPSLHPMTAL